MENEIDIGKYKQIFENIKQEVLKSQYKAMQIVNKELIFKSSIVLPSIIEILAYWENYRR